MLCISSLTGGGIKPKQYKTFVAKILQQYGFQHLNTFNKLEKMSFCFEKGSKTSEKEKVLKFETIKAKLKLITENVKLDPPSDISYTFNGYAGILMRLIESLSSFSSKDFKNLLPGNYQFFDFINSSSTSTHASNTPHSSNFPIFLLFLGGITFSEISAIRYIGKTQNKNFVILTTNITNGDQIMNCFL